MHERKWLVIVDHLATVNGFSVLHTPPVTLWELCDQKHEDGFLEIFYNLFYKRIGIKLTSESNIMKRSIPTVNGEHK